MDMFEEKTRMIGSRPSDHYFCSVCWFVCLSVCLFVCAEFLGHRLGDDLVDWNSGVSFRPYVHKKFFRFPSNLVCG